MSDGRAVTIIGAGIIGVCCGLALRRAGARVTIIDPYPPGEKDSFGNAGVIGPPYILPAATPAMLRRLPRMLTDRDHPLVLRMRAIPGLAPWFRQFVRAAGRVDENTAAAAAMQSSIGDDWRDVLRYAEAGDLVKWSGMLEISQTSAGLDAAKQSWGVMRSFGFKVEELGPAEIRKLEPALSPDICGGALLEDCGHTVDPLALTQRLHASFVASGGSFIRDRVKSIVAIDAATVRLSGDLGEYRAQAVVIAAGVRSPRLASQFGNRIAVVAERGYHIMLGHNGEALTRPLTALDRKVVITPMRSGVRMTTMAEFTTPDAPADYARAERLLKKAVPLLPDLRADIVSRWVGSRPSTPDSLPVIGRSPGHPSVFFAFGHGGRGLTLAATTARQIASAVMTGDANGTALSPPQALDVRARP